MSEATQEQSALQKLEEENRLLREQLSGPDLKVFEQNKQYKLENKKLTEEIRRLTTECVQLAFQNRELEGKVSDLETEVRETLGLVETHKSQELHLSQELEKVVAESQQSRTQLQSEHDQAVTQLQTELEEKIAALQAEHQEKVAALETDYSSKLEAKTGELGELKQQFDDLKEQFLSSEFDAVDAAEEAPSAERGQAFALLTGKLEALMGVSGRMFVEQVFSLCKADTSTNDPAVLEDVFEAIQDTAGKFVRNAEQEAELQASLTECWKELGFGDARPSQESAAVPAATEEPTAELEPEPEPEPEEPVVEAEPEPEPEEPVAEAEPEPEPEPESEEPVAEVEAEEPEADEAETDEPVAEAEPEAEPEEPEVEAEPEPEPDEPEAEEPVAEAEADEPEADVAEPEEPVAEAELEPESEPEEPVAEAEPEAEPEEPEAEAEPEPEPEAESEPEPEPEEPVAEAEPEPEPEEPVAEAEADEPEAEADEPEEPVAEPEPEAEPVAESDSEAAPQEWTLEACTALLKEGKSAEAADAFGEVLIREPDNLKAKVGRFLALGRSDQHEQAYLIGLELERTDLGEAQRPFQASWSQLLKTRIENCDSQREKKSMMIKLATLEEGDAAAALLEQAEQLTIRCDQDAELSYRQAAARIGEEDVTAYLLDYMQSTADKPEVFEHLQQNFANNADVAPVAGLIHALGTKSRAEAMEAEREGGEFLAPQAASLEMAEEMGDGSEDELADVFLEHLFPRSGVDLPVPSEKFEEWLQEAEEAAFMGSLRQALRRVNYRIFFEGVEVLTYPGEDRFLVESCAEPSPTLLFHSEVDEASPEEIRFLVFRRLLQMHRRYSNLAHMSHGLDDPARCALLKACVEIHRENEFVIPEWVDDHVGELQAQAAEGGPLRNQLLHTLSELYEATESDSFLELGDFFYDGQLNRKWLDPVADHFAAAVVGMTTASYATARDMLQDSEVFSRIENEGFKVLWEPQFAETYRDLRLRLQRLWLGPLKALSYEEEDE